MIAAIRLQKRHSQVGRATIEYEIATEKSDLIAKAEWLLGVLLTATIVCLLVIRAMHVGALWRDECAVVQLAEMPSVSDVLRNFQHEAFPPLFPLLVRRYAVVFGSSDTALRIFGFCVGCLLISAFWFNSRFIGRSVPLLSLALLGLNTTFLVWGTTLRGYGLGSVLIVLAFGLTVKTTIEPTAARVAATTLACLAAVQCLLHNVVLIGALTLSAAAVCLARHNLKQVIVFLGILAVCMISFVPYIRPYSSGSAWSVVVEFPVTLGSLWKHFNLALGDPTPTLAWLWHISFVTLIAVSIWRLYLLRSKKPASEWDLILFGSLVSVSAVIGYYEFLQLLNYLARSWYYLALLSLLAVALDFLGTTLASLTWVRIGRLLFAFIALIVLPINAWPRVIERQTNIDIVSKKVTELAKPTDLIVVVPWQFGIAFNRYYHAATPWITLPTMNDHQVHRYDLLQSKMTSPHPIDDVLEIIGHTLASGNRAWFVGGIKLPRAGENPRVLPPAPDSKSGWDNVAYMESWREQLGAFVLAHTKRQETIPLRSIGPINAFEDIPLTVVEGWQ